MISFFFHSTIRVSNKNWGQRIRSVYRPFLRLIDARILNKIRFKRFALATAYRSEKLDDPRVLKNSVEAIIEVPIPIVYPFIRELESNYADKRCAHASLIPQNGNKLNPRGKKKLSII